MDFNQAELYAKSSGDLEQFSTMEARYNLLEALENDYKLLFQGATPDLGVVKSRLLRLLFHVYDEFKRNKQGEKVEEFKEKLMKAKDLETIDSCFRTLDAFLDNLGINRMDRKSLGGNIVKRNKAGGL